MPNRPRPYLCDRNQEHSCEEVLALRPKRWRPNDTHLLKLVSTIAAAWLLPRHGTEVTGSKGAASPHAPDIPNHRSGAKGTQTTAAPAAPNLAPRPADNPASIFISYSHADRQLARKLYEGLSARGHNVWIDEEELRVGDSLTERIATAIVDIDFFLTLVSPTAAQSRWFRKELALAVSGEVARNSMRVMPLRVDGAKMPAVLGDRLYLDASLAEIDAAIDRISSDIAYYQADAHRVA